MDNDIDHSGNDYVGNKVWRILQYILYCFQKNHIFLFVKKKIINKNANKF